MCGITGFVGKGSRDDLERMQSSITHRGPDDKGIYFREGLGLAHTRLSIIDISTGGHQPMMSQDELIIIIFNGEIYNFKKLREELSDYSFRTDSDTEVIIALYKKYGNDCFEKLDGMFAIAIWDGNNGELVLARDRFGKKPLYWGIFDGTLIFGSELKTLIQHPNFKKEIDLYSLDKYLAYEYVPTPHSIFKNVYKLEPSSFLVFKNGIIKKEVYWKPDFSEKNISFEDAIKTLDRKFDESVSKRLVSDVPLGIFLSGGLDSSAVAYYAQKNTKEPIQTFSIGFEDKSFDESEYAKKVSNFLGTNHFHKTLHSNDVLESIPYLADVLDEPMADASILPTLMLSKFTKQHVTVSLGGDGGDEVFAGYPTFQADTLATYYLKMPIFLQKIFEKIISLLPSSDKNFGFKFKLTNFFQGLKVENKYRHQEWLGSFSDEQRGKLFKKNISKEIKDKNTYEDIDRYVEESGSTESNNQTLHTYMRTYMMDDVLVKVDRASMYHGLEVRAPLLDRDLVDFSNTLPYSFKSKRFKTKIVLKELMRGKLPNEIIDRPKKGFGIPLSSWLKNDLKSLCDEMLSKNKVEYTGLFNFEYIEELKQKHYLGKEDNRKLLWTLIVFQLWYDKWIKEV